MSQVLRSRNLLTTWMQCRTSWDIITGNSIQQLIPKNKRCFMTRVDTKALSNLRKQTGYGLSLCREALLESDNDEAAANKWLSDQATKRGLQKAEKLQARKTGEGLVGVLVEGRHAALVEVCCETDFVAQNEFFQELVAKTTATALDHRKMIVQKGLDLGGSVTHFREVLLTHKLKEMNVPSSGETVNDAFLQAVGRLGERVSLHRAVTLTTDETSVIGSYTHGPCTFNIGGCSMGKYAALVVVKPNNADVPASGLSSLAARLTQHIVGMNPTFISLDTAKNIDGVDKSDVLLEQNYLMDENITVKELLEMNDADVVDFLRLECGAK